MAAAALCVALGIALPLATREIPDAESVLLPAHLPVLLCGLLCGPAYGLACGILTPMLSNVLASLPPTALPGRIWELATYGFTAGLLVCLMRSRARALGVYAALIGAMLAGRVVCGVRNVLIFPAGEYTLEMWLRTSFVTALPGILIQLVLLPLVVLALWKSEPAAQP